MPDGPPIVAAIFAWLHLLAIGLGAGLLLSEYWLCRRMPDRLQVKLLGQVDLGYQFALIGSLATGLARTLYFGQTTEFYLSNRLFWLKIAIFLLVAIVAIAPSLQYIRWNREARAAPSFVPLTREVERVRSSIAFGLGLWLILPLIGILVARGYG
jgi:putative membrane protein